MLQKIATLQELVDVVKSRDLELEKRDMEIDDRNLEIKEKNLAIQKLKERLQMACDTSIASLRESKRVTDVKTQQINQLSLLVASLRADNETQVREREREERERRERERAGVDFRVWTASSFLDYLNVSVGL